MIENRHERTLVKLVCVHDFEILTDTISGTAEVTSRLLHQGELGLYCADFASRFHDFWSDRHMQNGFSTCLYTHCAHDIPIVQYVGNVHFDASPVSHQFDGYRVVALRNSEFDQLCNISGIERTSQSEHGLLERNFSLAKSTLGEIVSPLFSRGMNGILLQADKLAQFWKIHSQTHISQFPVLSYRRECLSELEIANQRQYAEAVATGPKPWRV
jgi:hypothetical protein